SPDSVIADMAGLIQAFSLRAPEVSIRNHSWSPNQKTPRAQLPAAVEAALDLSRTTGDGGRGTLQISSAGNNGQEGGYTSYDRYLNYRGVVAVCGVDDHGDPYIHSNPGPNLWVCAPTDNGLEHWGITSTLQRNLFWTGFSGTSASTPMVSGVAALVRAANRDLSWRDTKLILADSARVVNSGDSSWDEGASKYSFPSETYRYSHRYGFGVVDADRAVRLAQSWTLLPPEMSVSATQTTGFLVDTPHTPVEGSVDIGGSMTFVEHVEVTLYLGFGVDDFRDLDIELESPSGKISKLSVPYQCNQFAGDNCEARGTAVMSSGRHLGEDPKGTWKLRVTDHVSLFPFAVNSWSLQIYGHQGEERTSKASLSVTPDSVIEGGSFDYTITLDHAPGDNNRVTVNFLTADGTAIAGEDYTPVLGVGRDAVSFGPTETSKTVTVNTLRGVVGHDELPETLSASISRATLYVGLDATGVLLDVDPDTVSVTINDHPDDVPDVFFEAAAPGVVKNGQEAQFVVHVATPLSTDLTVPYETRPPNGTIDFYGSAVSSAGQSDFAASQSGTVTITAGKTSAAFTVATTDDSDPDYEFFQVHGRGTAPTGTRWRPDSEGGTSAEVVIEPDRAEATVYLVAVPSEPQEGDTVGLWAHFAQGGTVAKRTGITVTATGADGATADEFELTDGELRIARGKQGTLNNPRELGTITIAEDADYDPGETITLTGTTNRGNEVKGLTLAIGNTTPIPVNLVFTDSSEDGVVAEGGSVGVTVSLGRPLIAGETVEVTLRLPHDAAGTILGETTLVSVGNGEAGFSVFSPLADITRRHPVTNREVTYQEMTVRFSGAGAQTGTLTLTLGDDGVAQDPMLTVSLRITEVTVTGLDEEVAPGVKSILFIAVDAEGVLITPTALEIGEGETSTYQVSLRSDPGGPVTVSIESENEEAVTVNPSSLTFTSSGSDIWATPKSVTVTAVSDEDGSDEVVNITHKVSGYGDVTAGPLVGVVVRDDDIPNYRVPADWSLIPTGVSVGESFRLVLVTSQTTKASSDQISFYNDFVKEQVESGHSDIQAYAKDFRAWLSTEDVDGRDNTRTNPTDDGTGHPVYWLNTDTKVADNNAGLYGDGTGGWAGSGVGRDESGNSIPEATTAWWGSATDGTKLSFRSVEADSSDIRLTDVGNPTDAYFRNAAAKTNRRVLAFSPIFKVVGKPTIDILPDTDTVTEGTAATFTVSSTPPPFNNLTVSLWVNDGGDFLAGENEGSQMVTISGGSSSAVLSLPTTPDDVDEPLAPISVLVLDGQDYEVKSTSFVWLTVEDDDPTTVTLSRSDSGDLTEDGGTAEFTVTLGRPLVSEYLLPQEILTVPLTVSGVDASEYSITLKTGTGLNTGVSLSTSAPYSAALPAVVFAGDSDLMNPVVQTATLVFTSLDDSIDEGASETASIGLGTAVTSLGGGATTSGTATMTVTDNDTAALVFSSSTVSVTEGGSASYKVRLGSQPSGTVTVTIRDAGDVSVNPANLMFNATGNTDLWNTDQTVTVSAASDADISDDMVSLSHTASGGDYGSVTGSVSVTVEDDDVPELSVSGPTAGVTEGGEAVFTVTADYAPTANLSVLLTVTDAVGSDFVASGNEGDKQVTLTAGSKSVSYTVPTVGDSVDEPDGNIAVALRASSGVYTIADGSGLDTAAVNDDDSPGLMFSSSSVSVTEGGSSSYSVRLSTQPSGAVTVNITGGGDVSVSPSSLTFNPSGSTGLWSTDQTVTVSAEEDPDSVNDSVVLAHAASGGGYVFVSGDVTVSVTDNDTPNLVFSTSSVTVSEGSTTSYMVRLGSQPSDTVTVTISGADDVSVSPSSLTFNATGNTDLWNINQTVTVTAGQDPDSVNDTVTISHSASGGGYGSVTGSVTVTVEDDDDDEEEDVPALSISGPIAAVTEGGNAVFTVTADKAPTADLTVLLTVTDVAGSDFIASGDEGDQQVTLTAGSTTASYTVSTVEDNTDEPDGNITVTLRTSAGNYTIASGSGSATATIQDDDSTLPPPTPGLVFSSSSVSVSEGGSAEYTVRLGSQPSDTVTVTISGADDVSVSPSSLTFNATGNTDLWNINQTVTVTAGQDPDSVNDTVTISHSASGGGYGSVTGSVTVTVEDDDDDEEEDVPALSISGPIAAVTEGGNAVFTVTADKAPTADLTVLLTVTDVAGSDFIASGDEGDQQVTLTAGSTTASYTVSTVEDNTDEPDGNITVTLRTSAGNYTIASGSGSATATIQDDDTLPPPTPGLAFTPSSLTVAEGGSSSYMVGLATEPSDTVTISISGDGDVSVSPETLVFPVSDWETALAVTVNAGEDVDTADDSVSLSHSASGGGYTEVTGLVSVRVSDNDPPPPPLADLVVWVSAGDPVTEGGVAVFTITGEGFPDAPIRVYYTVSESGGFVRSSDEGNGSIRFNGSPVQVRVETVNDSRDEPSGWVRLRLVSRTGYEVSATGGAARVTVRDNDVAPPPKPTPPPLPSPEELPEYIDVEDEGVHYEGIRRLQANGVIEGTECEDGFCGSEPVEHWVMAVWLVRLLDGATSPDKPVSEFEEGPENEWWAPYTERLATLEISPPCTPEDQSVCSEEKIPRAQMAGLLARALKMDLGPPQGLFKDVDPNSPNAAAIETLYLVGIIKGCSPRPDLRFCPDEFTSRSQLATLIHRT
ncbi:MAG: hypothetical protein F4Z36_08045, partial [Acidimicrobiia bacterium]|nr:hypothetical protein [Acidimicrobiia bacterium]